MQRPDFTIGIEEEYLLVDKETLNLAEAPAGLMEACKEELDEQVSPEFLQCQIEIGTHVCGTVSEAREDLRGAGVSTEGLAWQEALDSGILELVREGRVAEAKERLQACLSSSSE